MAVTEMRKVSLVGEKNLREKLIKKLGEAGIFQSITPEQTSVSDFFTKSEVETDSIEENLIKLEEAINFLERFEDQGFQLGLFPSKVVVDSKDQAQWVKNFKWKDVYEKCRKIENDLTRIDEKSQSLQEEYDNLLPWRKVTCSFSELKKSKYVDFQVGVIPFEAKQSLLELTDKEDIHTQILTESGRRVYILLIFLKEERPRVDELFQKLRGEKQRLPQDIIPARRIQEIRTERKKLDAEKRELQKKAQKLTTEKVKLMVVHDHLYNLLQERKVNSHSHLSRYTFLLQGWIRKDDIPVLRKIIADFSQVDALVAEPNQEEKSQIPVSLSNPKLFKPFELITELYGLPRYVEIDPTPFLAPFFALFLALCLTDGGYGIILTILSFLIPRKMQVGEGGEKLFSVLFISGIITIFIGAITGGIFGLSLGQLPAFLAPLKKLVLFNPMENPMIFLVIALAVGIVHILTGIIIEMRDSLRRGDIGSAFLDQFTWIVLILGLLLLGAPFGEGFISGEGGSGGTGGGIPLTFSPSQMMQTWRMLPLYSQIGSIMAVCSIAVLFIFAGRKSKNVGIRLGKGAYEVYGIIQLFGDVLSYSRLLALGLATSVIATVVNTIAQMAGGIPILGPIAVVFILIFGHLGNLIINCLSGFIHTARLQFVEFFTKFYESGGKKFEPLKREGKYTVVMDRR